MRRWFMLPLAAMVIALGGCRHKEPAVCNVGPPDDPRYYQRWADDITAARCKGLQVDHNAILKPDRVLRNGS